MKFLLEQKITRLLCIITLVLLTACKEQILHDLSEQRANDLLARLDQEGIEAVKNRQPDGNWAIAVDQENVQGAIRYLRSSRVFRNSQNAGREKSSMMSSREDQLFRHERSLSGEIESTLTSIDGVLESRVHLNLPPTDPLFGYPIEKGKSGSASVLMIVYENVSIEQKEVKQLVSGASGIPAEKISVMIRAGIGSSSESLGEQSPVLEEISSAETDTAKAMWTFLSSEVGRAIALLFMGGLLLLGLFLSKRKSLLPGVDPGKLVKG